jgi:hypothetical protein
MHVARVLVRVPLRLADRPPQAASISSRLTFTFVSPLSARGGPPAARGRGREREPRARGVPCARCNYLSCVSHRV